MVQRPKLIIYSIFEAFLDVFPRHSGSFLRRKLLNLFGAQIHKSARVYSGVRVSVPNNLILEEESCLGPNVVVYNLGRVHIKKKATISQEAKLICASHNIRSTNHELTTKEIIVNENAWIAAYAIVGPHASIEKNVVIGLGSVFKGTSKECGIYVGNPAVLVSKRRIKA
jgi:putative colanic acid biosynthesis acetyltransferase WcaF